MCDESFDSSPFFNSVASGGASTRAGTRALIDLDEEERAGALGRFEAIRPFLEYGVPLARIAEEREESARTLRRWVARYREGGLVGLARRPRSDRGRRRVDPELVTTMEGLYLRKPRPTIASVHRRVCDIAQRHGWPPPSYKVVYEVVKAMEPAMVDLAHEGTKAYKQTHDLLYTREAERPNEMWQADHKHLDVWLADGKGEPRKPWLTVIEDDHSRAIMGYYPHFDAPSIRATALALRQAIWRKEDQRWRVFGVPDVFYTDHGSDFVSRHMEQVAADLRVQLFFSKVGEPRGRGKIERLFKTLDEMLLRDLPGYGPGKKPPRGPYLTLPEFDERLGEWIVGTYQTKPHGGTDQAPLERWEARSFLPRTADALEQLDLLLMTEAKPRRVRRDGVHFATFTYVSPVFAAYVGEDVTVRYDPRDLAEIRVYRAGRQLCRAVCHELSGLKVTYEDVEGARSERRARLRRGISERSSVTDVVLGLKRRDAPDNPSPKPARKPVNRLKLYRNE